MKKQITFSILLLFLAFTVLKPKPGCLDNSYHLKEKYDPKEYHQVDCNCPCDYWAMRGLRTDRKDKCLECGHAHNPGPNPFVPDRITTKAQNKAPARLQALIDRYNRAKSTQSND